MPRGRPRSRPDERTGHRTYRDEELALELSNPQPLEGGFVIPAPPAPPEGGDLRPDCLVLWDRYWLSHLPRALDAVDGVDRYVVHEWILSIHELGKLRDLIAQTGSLVKGSTGQAVLNPLYRRIDRLNARIDICEAKLGANPRDRMRLGIAAGQAQQAAKALADLLDDEDGGTVEGEYRELEEPRGPTIRELRELARVAGVSGYWRMRKAELIEALER